MYERTKLTDLFRIRREAEESITLGKAAGLKDDGAVMRARYGVLGAVSEEIAKWTHVPEPDFTRWGHSF